MGDTYSVKICRDELIALEDGLKRQEDLLSPLGKMIKDQPKTEFPDELSAYIEELGGAA